MTRRHVFSWPGFVLAVGLALLLGCTGQKASQDESNDAATGTATQPNTPAASAATEQVEATVNTVGTRGRSYGGGIVTEPVSQLFKQKDRIHLMQLEQAIKLYKAEHGRLPQTHEEFMQKIVNNPQYGIRLPELPPGHRYVWDPKQEKLLVERPAPSSAEKQP